MNSVEVTQVSEKMFLALKMLRPSDPNQLFGVPNTVTQTFVFLEKYSFTFVQSTPLFYF